MIGVIVNTLAVICGSSVGLIFRRGIPKRLTDAVMIAIGLCTIYIGVSGSLKGQNTLIAIISMVIGAVAGTLIDLDKWLSRLGDNVAEKTRLDKNGGPSVAEGFVTSSLLFCVGAMTVVGSLNSGLSGDNELIFTKSLLDLISSTMLAASLGVGVLFSAVFIFLFQGAIVLMAQYLAPVLTDSAIAEMTCVGSLMIIALGLNMLGISRFKVANYLPALIIAPIAVWIAGLI